MKWWWCAADASWSKVRRRKSSACRRNKTGN